MTLRVKRRVSSETKSHPKYVLKEIMSFASRCNDPEVGKRMMERFPSRKYFRNVIAKIQPINWEERAEELCEEIAVTSLDGNLDVNMSKLMDTIATAAVMGEMEN